MKNKNLLILASALALGLATPALANDSTKADASITDVKGDAAFKDLDAEIDQLNAAINHSPSSPGKVAAQARLKAFKERRSELRKNYVQGRYDELKADVRTEANNVGSGANLTFSLDPARKAANNHLAATSNVRQPTSEAGVDAHARASSSAASIELGAYKLRPTDTNREEAKAGLKALEQKIDELDDRADRMPRGADRDLAQRRVKALEERKDQLEREFNKVHFDTMIDDVHSEWTNLRD